jgi:methionyl-tRNA formyltransferase
MPFSFTNNTAFEAPKIRIVFMGTPEFSAAFLQALIQNKYQVVSVFTQPDKPQGRDQETVFSPVKTLAVSNNIPVEQPMKITDAEIDKLKDLKPDLLIVAAYGRILPQKFLDIAGFGCINVHPSLLPKYRGASPIQNALLNGETETGVSIMLMDAGMDTGPVLAQSPIAIDPDDTAITLEQKVTIEAVPLLMATLPQFIKQEIEPQPQDNAEATLCELIEREDGRIFWNQNAEAIYNRYRAFTPWPGVFAYWKKTAESLPLRIKLIKLSFQKNDPALPHTYGEIFEVGEKVGIATGGGIIFLETVQLEGKDALPIREFLRGYPNFIGSTLE